MVVSQLHSTRHLQTMSLCLFAKLILPDLSALLTVIPFTALGKMLGFVALPTAYFAYLIPCILLYMVLATSIKKAYVRHFGELL